MADNSLCRVGKFVHVTAVDVVEVTSPAILLLRDEKSDAMQYDGNFQQDSIEEFILHFYNPRFAELQQQNEAGKRYTKQFFASQTVKFLLLLGSSDQADHSPHARLITDWATIAAVHNDDAIFSYSFGDVPGVSELFQLPPVTDNSLFNDWLLRIFPWLQKQYVYPIVVAYDATKKGKYLSSVISHSENSRENSFDSCTLFDSETGDNELSLFVSQVLNGSAKRILISAEKAVSSSPVNQLRQILINQLKYVFEPTSYISHVVQATGSSVEKICFESGMDVLLAVQNDNMFGCDECLQLDPLFDLLARAFAYEKRITIARINVASNELPPEWGVRTYPSLLWFPSKSKDAAGQTAIAPEPFWSGNLAKPFAISYQDRSMPHLLEFTYQIEKKTSFSKQSLRVANKNQINNMYADIESSQIQHRNEYEKRLRNFGRKIYADVLADYFFGEVVRDGHRIDVVLLAVVFILGCMMHPMISCLFFKTNSTAPYLERVSRDLDNGSDLVGEIDRHDDAMDQS